MISAFVVAGGRSTRMGEDKARLPWGEGTLLDHALARLRQVTDDVRILCGPTPRYAETGVPLVCDAREGTGALGATHAALRQLKEDGAALLLAIDLPLVPVGLLARLAAADETWDAVVPLSPGGPEPLCALYRASCRDAVGRRLAASDLKMTSFWPDVRVHTLAPLELAAYGDPARLFLNVNRREDYEASRSCAVDPPEQPS